MALMYYLQVWEGKPVDEKKEFVNVSQKLMDVASDLSREPSTIVLTDGDLKVSENGSVSKIGDALNSVKQAVVPEKRILSNGISNGC